MKGRRQRRLGVGIVCLAFAGIAAPVTGADAGSQVRTQQELKALAAVPGTVSAPIRDARAALARAERRLAEHRYRRALTALSTLRWKAGKAHQAAVNQIGKPPADPESDDPPGPPSVLAVLSLEHRIGVRVPVLFNGMQRTKVVQALRYTLWITHTRRDQMLDKVIALDPEGAGGDYADGMADILPAFDNEVNRLQKGLDTYTLTDSGRVGLTAALERATATRDVVQEAFGGGE